MKINKIVSFGCSWPHGVELVDPNTTNEQANEPYRLSHSYPGLIAAHYNWTLDDRTKLNTSLPEMLQDFDDWVQQSSLNEQMQSLVLIGLTHETGANTTQEDAVFENVVTHFDDEASRRNISIMQFNVMARQHRMKLPTLIESSSALEMLVIRDKPRKAPLFTEHKFPNEKGHKIISEFLIDKIESVIINDV